MIPVTTNLQIRRRVAEEQAGQMGIHIAWTSQILGECDRCPGDGCHNNAPGKIWMHVEGSPNLHCFNESCAHAVAAFNTQLQKSIYRAELAEDIRQRWNGRTYRMPLSPQTYSAYASTSTPAGAMPAAPRKTKPATVAIGSPRPLGIWDDVVGSLVPTPLPNLDITPGGMSAAWLRRVFRPDDFVQIATNIENGKVYNVGKLLAHFDNGGKMADLSMGENCWIRVNPVKPDTGSGGDKDVTAYRNGLLEFDTLKKLVGDKDGIAVPLETQWAFILYLQSIGVPIMTVMWSGSKSLQCIVSVNAPNADEYRAALIKLFAKVGGPCDQGMFNPSRYCRLPGCPRLTQKGWTMQTLLEIAPDAKINDDK